MIHRSSFGLQDSCRKRYLGGVLNVANSHSTMFNPLTRRTDSSMTHRSTQRAGRDHRAETTTPVRAAATGNARVSSELEILLALGAAHGEQALVAALHRAVAFRCSA